MLKTFEDLWYNLYFKASKLQVIYHDVANDLYYLSIAGAGSDRTPISKKLANKLIKNYGILHIDE